MTKVVYIVGRTDHRVSLHDKQFIRETSAIQMSQFVTTGNFKDAKKFKDVAAAMRFLARTNPSNTFRTTPTLGLAAYCYEILILDSAELSTALGQGRTPQGLKDDPLTARVFCATLSPQTSTTALRRGI